MDAPGPNLDRDQDAASPPAYDAPSYPQAATEAGPDGSNQLEMIKEMKRGGEIDMEAGETWFLVSRSWFRRWATACSGVAESKDDDADITLADVGPIDNSDILTVEGKLKQPLELGREVEILPQNAWDFLLRWYGCKQAPIERTVVGGQGQGQVEFYPPTFLVLQLLPSSSSSESNVTIPSFPHTPTTSLSSGARIKDLKEFAADTYQLQRPLRLWRLPQPEPTSSVPDLEGPAYIFAERIKAGGSELIEQNGVDDESTLIDALLVDPETRLAVEEQTASGTWVIDAEAIKNLPALVPTETTSEPPAEGHGEKKKGGLFSGGFFDKMTHHKSANTLQPKYKNKDGSTSTKGTPIATPSNNSGLFGALTRSKGMGGSGRQRGLTGLQNLGNTCFMNSALQCMSNTKELQEYFVSGVYKDELNRDNPLGMRGQVAEAFGQLIERIWSSSGSSVAPREFKQALSRFAPQFSGYGQQDTQELLAFLLDGVHEDLNRIKKKPATNAPDWEGGGDKELVELAQTCWEQYRSRNDSVIVDLFQGQYRSTVVCPDCDKVSITFDPFMYVTTNLPVTKKWIGKVYYVPLDPAKDRFAIELEVPKTGTVKMLKAAVAKFMDVDPKKLVITEEWKGKFWKAWHDDEMVIEIDTTKDAIVFFETLEPVTQLKPRFYGKNKPAAAPAPSADAPIVVPVLHKKSNRSSLNRPSRGIFGSSSSSYSSEELFGSPFLLTLTREEASTPAGISRALARQYARVTKLGDELLEAVDAQLEELEAPEAPVVAASVAAAPPAPAPAPAATPLPATPPPEANMDVDPVEPVASTSTLPEEPAPTVVMPAPPAAIPDALSMAPSTSSLAPPVPVPTPAPAVESTPAPPRLSIFSLFVSDRPSRNIPLGNDAFNTSSVPLAKRVRRASTPDTDMFAPPLSRTNLPGSFPREDDDSSMSTDTELETSTAATTGASTPIRVDDAEEATSLAPKEPAPKPAPQPIIQTGDYLIAEWDSAALAHFLGTNGGGEPSTWATLTPFVDPALAEARARQGGPKKVITIQDCLTEFTKEERLGEDDTWYCPRCKDHKQATKKVELWKVPDILVFAFKRFSSGRYTRDKIDDFVDFPLENFNLEPFVEGAKVERRLAGQTGEEDPESLIYDLYAVDNHYGGMGGGHYTAYAKNHENSKWYDFDDGRVSEITNPESVKTKAAYLVMYRRRTTRPIGAKSRELIDSAIQSRNVSASTSEAGGPPPVVSNPNSPFGSTDNLPGQVGPIALSGGSGSYLDSSYLPPSPPSFDHDDDEELYGDSEPRTFVPNDHFSGIFPMRNAASSGEVSDNEAEVGSGPNSRRGSPPPFDDEFENTPFAEHVMPEAPLEEEDPIDLRLDEQVPSTMEQID
ncbi:hypothetical protein BCR35DRAFT_334236 [Leucosporidium creatinivorum]|uniref:ubiquitinyl hydrolase 1 n=1 Tax=Leucosporidium creatinivorum TaxID=106004 RepID=A0A1Y2EHB1_9BASI|nr:hypothetical protein BCR35DRAFT_334236 [Leucosporidium creatinivorum]